MPHLLVQGDGVFLITNLATCGALNCVCVCSSLMHCLCLEEAVNFSQYCLNFVQFPSTCISMALEPWYIYTYIQLGLTAENRSKVGG